MLLAYAASLSGSYRLGTSGCDLWSESLHPLPSLTTRLFYRVAHGSATPNAAKGRPKATAARVRRGVPAGFGYDGR